MKKHIGHDHTNYERFHVVGIDPESNSVVLEYVENVWSRNMEHVRQLSYQEFLEALIDGALEVYRVDNTA